MFEEYAYFSTDNIKPVKWEDEMEIKQGLIELTVTPKEYRLIRYLLGACSRKADYFAINPSEGAMAKEMNKKMLSDKSYERV